MCVAQARAETTMARAEPRAQQSAGDEGSAESTSSTIKRRRSDRYHGVVVIEEGGGAGGAGAATPGGGVRYRAEIDFGAAVDPECVVSLGPFASEFDAAVAHDWSAARWWGQDSVRQGKRRPPVNCSDAEYRLLCHAARINTQLADKEGKSRISKIPRVSDAADLTAKGPSGDGGREGRGSSLCSSRGEQVAAFRLALPRQPGAQPNPSAASVACGQACDAEGKEEVEDAGGGSGGGGEQGGGGALRKLHAQQDECMQALRRCFRELQVGCAVSAARLRIVNARDTFVSPVARARSRCGDQRMHTNTGAHALVLRRKKRRRSSYRVSLLLIARVGAPPTCRLPMS